MNFKNSVAKQLLLWIMLTSSLLTLFITTLHLYVDYHKDMSALNERLIQIETSYLPSITSALWVEDDDQIQVQTTGIKNLPEIVLVQLIRDEEIFINLGADNTKYSRVGRWPITYQFDGQETLLGELYVVSDLEPVYQRLFDKVLLTLVTQGAKTFIVSFVILYIVFLVVGRHLTYLANSMENNQGSLDKYQPLELNRKNQKNDDELSHLVGSYNNMRKNLALSFQKLAVEKNNAEQANKLKSEFLANISHEVKTPMNGVYGMTHLLLNTSLDKKQTEYVKTIQTSSNHMLDLLNSILDFSKIEAGKLEKDDHQFDLLEFLNETIDLFKPLAQEKSLELTLVIDHDFENYILGDSAKLKQVLTNLISNAIKFTEEGCVCLKVTVTPSEQSFLIEFSVIDSGRGIEKEKLDIIFDKFSQAENSTTREFGGTGLGLAICHKLVHFMGGTLYVNSQLNIGSCFHFSLSFVKAEAKLNFVDEDIIHLEGVSVLVVDDQPFNTKLMSELLSTWKMKVVTLNDPTLVIKTISRYKEKGKHFELIIIDKNMPEMDGYELFEALERCTFDKPIKVIMTSAYANEYDMRKCRELGILEFLETPVAPNRLQQSILNAISSSGFECFQEKLARLTAQLKQRSLAVLVVDDSKINRQVCTCMLNDIVEVIVTADNGEQAFDFWQQQYFDIILMDCHMPVVDGFEATRMIRDLEEQNKNTGKTKTIIIAITASDAALDRERCFDVGMDGFIAKPYGPNELVQVIEECLEERTNKEKIIKRSIK